MNEREIELVDYLRVLWRQKWIIVVTFVTAVIAAWLAAQAIRPTYRAEASLLLLPSLASELGAESAGSVLLPNAYKAFATSTEVVRSIARAVGIPEETSLDALKRQLHVSLDPLIIAEDRFAKVEDQVVLTFSATWSTPQRAADIVSAWISAFEEGFGAVFLERAARSAGYFQQNLDQAEIELKEVVEERTQLLSDSPLDLLRREVTALLESYSNDVIRLHEARMELEISRARLAALEVELSIRKPSQALQRSLDPDTLLAALAAGLSPREYQDLLEVRSEEEALNEAYFLLDESVARDRALIAALESEISFIESSIAAFQSELTLKQQRVLETEAVLEELDSQVRTLQDARAKMATNLLEAKIALAETLAPIRILDEPLAPSSPISPKMTAKIATAGFLGLLVGMLLAFFVDYLGKARERESISISPVKRDVSEEPRDHQSGGKTEANRDDRGKDAPP